ncbi:hypothetical protein ACOBV8_16035 [Pseudoalteromonas espejiana]
MTKSYVDKYPGRVELFEVSDGLGKTNAINKALAGVECDFLVFSDANVYLKKMHYCKFQSAIKTTK